MRILAHLFLTAALIAPQSVLALDPGKVPPITLGTGSSGDASAVNVTPSPLAPSGTLARSLADQDAAIAAKAPLASPTFTGTTTMPKMALTGTGSTGDVSAMSVTAGDSTRSLATWFPLLAPLANPTFTGIATIPALTLTALSDGRIAHSPTGNTLSTLAGLQLQGSTSSETQREFLASFGLTSNNGATQTDTSGNGDKVPLYSGMVQQPGSGNAWSLNTLITRQSGVTKSTTGFELDVNNNDQHLGEALGAAGLGRPFGYGLIVTGAAPYRSTAAIEIGGPGSSALWNRGVVISSNSVKQASFQDLTVSDISLDVRGGHLYPIDLANSGVTKAAIRLPKQNNIAAGNPDSNGIRDDSGNINLLGTDASGNVLFAPDGSTFAIIGSTLLPKSSTQNIGNSTSRFNLGYMNNLVLTPNTPNTSSSACPQGQISIDTNYIYVCVATNTWKRAALGAF